MTRRKTDSEFRKEVKALVEDEYLVLGHYKGCDAKIKIKHQKCSNIFETRPADFLRGHGCPKCANKNRGAWKRKTQSEFRAEVKSLVGDEYLVLSQYKNNHTQILFKHQKCGQVFKMTPNSFCKGTRCPTCANKRSAAQRTKSDAEFKKEVKTLTGNEYQLLDKYVKSDVKIRFKHRVCGCVFSMTPNSFLNGRRCPKCMKKRADKKLRRSPDDFKRWFYQATKGEYALVSKYKTSHIKVSILHLKCGNLFKMRPLNFMRGQRCPFCKCSKGEKLVRKYLRAKRIIFKTQYKIADCRDKLPMPFDFAIFNKDQSLNCLIEYQGAQHFINPFEYQKEKGPFNTQDILNTQKHDAMKLQYCKDHGIKLIRINHPQTSSKSNSIEFIERLVNRTLNKELHVV